MSDEQKEQKATVPETIKEVVKEKKVADMTKVREAKRKKQEQRDSTLTALQSQMSSMASLMKTDVKADKTTDVDSDVEDGPAVVTRKRQKVDDSDTPSMRKEICRTVLVAALGLGTWYVSNIMFTPPKTSVLDRIQAPVIPISPPAIAAALPSRPAEPPKKKIGASGLLE